MNFWKPYLGRIIFTSLGLVVAILFLTIGFWKTLLILICCGLGFLIGLLKDKALGLPEWLYFWRNKW